MKQAFNKKTARQLGKVLLDVVPLEHIDLPQVKQMIDDGADLSMRDEDGQTALILAMWQDNMPLIEMLVNAGADVHFSNDHGETVLMHAVYADNIPALKMLLSKKVNIDAVNETKTSALMIAAWQGSFDTVKILVEAGADLYLRDIEDKTALILAEDGGALGRENDQLIMDYLLATPQRRAKEKADAREKKRREILKSIDAGLKEPMKLPKKANLKKGYLRP